MHPSSPAGNRGRFLRGWMHTSHRDDEENPHGSLLLPTRAPRQARLKAAPSLPQTRLTRTKPRWVQPRTRRTSRCTRAREEKLSLLFITGGLNPFFRLPLARPGSNAPANLPFHASFLPKSDSWMAKHFSPHELLRPETGPANVFHYVLLNYPLFIWRAALGI